MSAKDNHIEKMRLCERLLETGTVMVVVDAAHADVEVPAHLAGDRKLRLNIDYRFGAAMQVDENGIRATLSFGGVDFPCVLPWPAVYVFLPHADGHPRVFPDDIPPEVMEEIGASHMGSAPTLRLVPDDSIQDSPKNEPDASTAVPPLSELSTDSSADSDNASESADDDQPDPPTPTKRRGHLRVVK